jgi:hypothetical protein
MPTFDELLTALREDSDRSVLPQAEALRAAAHRQAIVRRGAGTLVTLLVAAVLVAATTLTGSPASKPPVNTPTVAPTPSRDAMVSGRVTSNGTPVSGAVVQIQLQPNNDTESKVLPGQTVPVWRPDPTTTSSDGNYSIVVDPTQIPSEFREGSDGLVNFEIDVTIGQTTGIWYAPLVACAPEADHYWCPDQGTQPLIIDFEMGARPQVRDSGYMDHNWHDLPTQ